MHFTIFKSNSKNYNMNISKNSLINFGLRIKQKRLAQNLTQSDLGALCNFNRTYIYLIETGQVNISFTKLLSLSKALKTNPQDLVMGI